MNEPFFLSPFFSPYEQRLKKIEFTIFLGVFFFHAVLLFFSIFRSPSPPLSKKPDKIMVQTIRLAPLQPALPPPSPISSVLPSTKKEEASIPVLEENHEATKQLSLSTPSLTTPVTEPSIPVIKKEQIVAPKGEKKTISPKNAPSPSKKIAPVKKEEKKSSPKPQPQKNLEEEKKKKEKLEKEKVEKEKEEKKRQQEQREKEKKRKELAAAQENVRQKEQALEKELAKFLETSDKISLSSSSVNLEKTSLPQALNLHIDALFVDAQGNVPAWGVSEISYQDELAYRLKRLLKLPEYGAIKIKLTLDRLGKVLKVETINSESKKNTAYIEKEIPKILFSPFGQRFQDVVEYPFFILLHNEN